MEDKQELLSAQYGTLERNTGEDLGSYILRFTKTRRKQYSNEDRIALARLQMELRQEPMESDAEIGAEGLFYLETLIAAYDYHDTFKDEEMETDEYRNMLDHRRRLLKFLKSRLKSRGIMPKTAKSTLETIRETEQMVEEIAPIREITKKLQAAVKKLLAKA